MCNNSFVGEVAIQQGTLKIIENGETTKLQWAIPSGFYTALYISQRFDPSENCRELAGDKASSMSNDLNCFLHNVTGRTNIIFNSSLGQVFSLQVYQGYDLIDERRFTTDSKKSGSPKSSGRCLVDYVKRLILICILN